MGLRRRNHKLAIKENPKAALVDAKIVIATHEAADADLKAAAREKAAGVREFSFGDRVCWAALVTGLHVLALK